MKITCQGTAYIQQLHISKHVHNIWHLNIVTLVYINITPEYNMYVTPVHNIWHLNIVTSVYNNITPEYNRYVIPVHNIWHLNIVTPVYNNITPEYNRYVTPVYNSIFQSQKCPRLLRKKTFRYHRHKSLSLYPSLSLRVQVHFVTSQSWSSINPYPTAFPYGNGMVLHFYQQQESSTTKTVHKVINKGLTPYV